MLLGVVLSGVVARLSRIPVPLVQIAFGAAIFYSDLTSVDLDPDVFFLVLLPPLLFLDGWRIPKDDLLGDAPTILTLALGLVVFTVLGVGWFIHALLPAIALPMAFALASVISPTDPIAVSAIASRTPMPLRMRRILEGESLFNDASGLVCMRFAVAAALTGAFSLGDALLDFAWVAAGGLSVGIAVTWLLMRLLSWSAATTKDHSGAQILATLLLPSAAYRWA
jgi:CPA1 family monovalent cation:H+ antiporter